MDVKEFETLWKMIGATDEDCMLAIGILLNKNEEDNRDFYDLNLAIINSQKVDKENEEYISFEEWMEALQEINMVKCSDG